MRDLMIVHPTETPDGSPLVSALDAAIVQVLDRPPRLVASPGTYDQKHFARIAGVTHCVAYGRASSNRPARSMNGAVSTIWSTRRR